MLGGHIILQKLHNRGAALSFMEKTPKLLTGVTTVVTAGMTAFYAYLIKKPKQLFLKTGVGMILGGAWSNVWDRITRYCLVCRRVSHENMWLTISASTQSAENWNV